MSVCVCTCVCCDVEDINSVEEQIIVSLLDLFIQYFWGADTVLGHGNGMLNKTASLSIFSWNLHSRWMANIDQTSLVGRREEKNRLPLYIYLGALFNVLKFLLIKIE